MKTIFQINPAMRRGMTLIELLVVAGIMVLMVSVAAPMLNPVAEGRQAREATRGISAALDTARARAIRLGRTCGVALVPYEKDNKVCIQLDQVTAPPTISTTCSVSGTGISGVGDVLGNGFKSGDRIQINHTGAWFRYTGSGWTMQTGLKNDSGNQIGYVLYDRNNVDCTISYAPVPESGNAFAKALGLDTGFQVPKGIVVDLFYSGVGESGTWTTNVGNALYPPTILFYPDGSVSLYLRGTEKPLTSDTTVDNSIYLLVGRWDRGLDMAEDGYRNTQDPNSYWVIVNTQTGMVRVAENNAYSGTSSNILGANDISNARLNARDINSAIGGR